jgi:hypothetical protein
MAITRTAYEVFDEFAVFFEELRDSLRNIELDIEKYLAEKNLLKSESFWQKFIMKAKSPGRIEPKLWDFKETLEMWHAPNPERQNKQVDFCKLIAAFANREGGAIIIGVTDTTREIVGINDLENKIKSLSEAINKWLDYSHEYDIVHLQPVSFEQSGKLFTCLVVCIPQTAGVVRVKGVSGQYYYPDRDQTGISYPDARNLENRKMHLKAGDNFAFMQELKAFLYDK